jgi:RES domain-containing protein
VESPGSLNRVNGTISLACDLETFVHVEPDCPLPTYVQIAAEVPEGLALHDISESDLPAGWRTAEPAPVALRDMGTKWITSLVSAVARGPATTTRGEYSYLLNPVHPDFQKIQFGSHEPFEFDPRMWKHPSGI